MDEWVLVRTSVLHVEGWCIPIEPHEDNLGSLMLFSELKHLRITYWVHALSAVLVLGGAQKGYFFKVGDTKLHMVIGFNFLHLVDMICGF